MESSVSLWLLISCKVCLMLEHVGSYLGGWLINTWCMYIHYSIYTAIGWWPLRLLWGCCCEHRCRIPPWDSVQFFLAYTQEGDFWVACNLFLMFWSPTHCLRSTCSISSKGCCSFLSSSTLVLFIFKLNRSIEAGGCVEFSSERGELGRPSRKHWHWPRIIWRKGLV